jgi:hypothetical protein
MKTKIISFLVQLHIYFMMFVAVTAFSLLVYNYSKLALFIYHYNNRYITIDNVQLNEYGETIYTYEINGEIVITDKFIKTSDQKRIEKQYLKNKLLLDKIRNK